MWSKIAIIASVTLPLWNIPLIIRMIKRKSSKDISIAWAIGVWLSLLLMLPDGLKSNHLAWKLFTSSNFSFFSIVFFNVIYFRVYEKYK